MAKQRDFGYTGSNFQIIIMIFGTLFVAASWCIKAAFQPATRRLSSMKPATGQLSQNIATQPFRELRPRRAAFTAMTQELAKVQAQRDGWKAAAEASRARQAEILAEAERLKAQKAAAEEDRDRWKLQALARAYQHTGTSAPSEPNERKKFMRLRAVVVKTIHPDYGGSSPAEKEIRAELFKRLWPEIERIQDEV